MKEKNITALVSCFARCYHYKNNKYRIFCDNVAEKILNIEEYDSISNNMSKGIKFFNPSFSGTEENALRWIVDNQLPPSVLGRSAFCEKLLSNAIKIGCRQYLIFASGYDTFAYRSNINDLKVFEIDKSEMIEDKLRRLDNNKIDYSKVDFIRCDFTNKNWISAIINSNYNKNQISFCSLLGISYYLRKEDFSSMIKSISDILCNGSSIVFDYPTYEDSKEMQINEKLASTALEEMTNTYFYNYNTLNPDNKMTAPKGVFYCLAVKK